MSSSTGVTLLVSSLKWRHSLGSSMTLGQGAAEVLVRTGWELVPPWHLPTHTGEPPPEFRVVDLDGHGVLDAVRVLQGELKELSCPQHSVDSAGGCDGLAEHLVDALSLDVIPVGIDDLQVPGTLLRPALPGGKGP